MILIFCTLKFSYIREYSKTQISSLILLLVKSLYLCVIVLQKKWKIKKNQNY